MVATQCPKACTRLMMRTVIQLILANEVEFDEEFKMPELAELANIENWSFMHPQILNSGRVTYPQELTEEERDLLKESDPQAERFVAIATAKRKRIYAAVVDGMETAWIVRQQGDF